MRMGVCGCVCSGGVEGGGAGMRASGGGVQLCMHDLSGSSKQTRPIGPPCVSSCLCVCALCVCDKRKWQQSTAAASKMGWDGVGGQRGESWGAASGQNQQGRACMR